MLLSDHRPIEDPQRRNRLGLPAPPKVVVVGEKPLLARSLQRALEDESFLDFAEVDWIFTATRGHVVDLEFEGRLRSREQRRGSYTYLVQEQVELFTQPVTYYSLDARLQMNLKRSGRRMHRATVEATLEECCQDADFVVLCLDNDLEGEKIAEEVEQLVQRRLRPPRFQQHQTQIWRCRFSSLDPASLRRAMALPPIGSLGEINRDFVAAVDLRRELDLRLGFAVSRAVKHLVWNHWLTLALPDFQRILRVCCPAQDRGVEEGQQVNHDTWPVMSYGPCQLPTLGFLEKNEVNISTFSPKDSWKVRVQCAIGEDRFEAWSEQLSCEMVAQVEAKNFSMAASDIEHTMMPNLEVSKCPRSGFKRPQPLNTSQMLQLASDCLGMAPEDALREAQDLYEAGRITYPRSETTAYDLDTDLEDVVQSIAQRHGSVSVCRYAQRLLRPGGMQAPRQDGRSRGDHDPIMPVVISEFQRQFQRQVSAAAESLYQLIVRAFLASLSADAVVEETTVTFREPSGSSYSASGHRVRSLGWLEIMPIIDVDDAPLPDSMVDALIRGTPFQILDVSVQHFQAEPPERLTEARLLALMDAHGIGTDASMTTHIAKIIERGYARVVVPSGPSGLRGDRVRALMPQGWFRSRREVHPTILGSILYRWYMLACPQLALPTVRADVEDAYLQVSRGEQDAAVVKQRYIGIFKAQFLNIFDPRVGNRWQRLLERFFRNHADLNSDPDWRLAERNVQNVDFGIMAATRRRRMGESDASSAPPEPKLKQCLMIDAQVLDSEGRLRDARRLSVGDTLQVVFVHQGQLGVGLGSVSRVRCLQERERDIATVFLHRDLRPSVQVTSNHSLMAKHTERGIDCGPVVARELSSQHQAVFKEAQRLVYRPPPIMANVALVECAKASKSVIELELDSGETAVWLHAGPSGSIASYGESPEIVVDSAQRHVSIWGFSRCPRDFRAALANSDHLEACRSALAAAGFSYSLSSGGYMFVLPDEARMVLHALRRRNIAPRPSEVVVSPEFETRLQDALGLVPPRHNVRRRVVDVLHLDTAMADIAYYTNACPFDYFVAGVRVQGRRTFINIESDGFGTDLRRVSSAPDLDTAV